MPELIFAYVIGMLTSGPILYVVGGCVERKWGTRPRARDYDDGVFRALLALDGKTPNVAVEEDGDP